VSLHPGPSAVAPSGPTIDAVLAVEPLGGDRFRGGAERSPDESYGGMFGGHALALGLRAAGATVDADRVPHSLHAYFLRAGDGRKPLEISVFRDTDGRSFSARRVVVSQDDTPVFTMTASFHVPEEGPDDQTASLPLDAPDPETLESRGDPRRAQSVVEVRNAGSRYGTDNPSRAWGRAAGPISDDPLVNACVLVHFSDLYTGLAPIPATGVPGGPSLDHAFWFHRPARLDDWIFMELEPVSSSRGRGVYTGSFFDRRGVLVATLAQEMLLSTSRPPRTQQWRGI
jgi:acyl-CoA thioesterase-2